MAVFGRFQVYYGKIKSELEIIREDYEYTNLSKAFAHWYLVNHVKVSEQEIGETIIDGNGDNGIDAITVNGDVMTLYQFRFVTKIFAMKGIKIELLGIAIIPLGIAVTTNNFWGYVLGVLGFGVAVVGCFLKDNH